MMTASKRILSLLLVGLLTACGPSPNSPGYDYDGGYPEPTQAPSAAPADLASLFTGQIVNEEEQLLRDTLKRQVLLDFPVKIGVIYYQFNSQLDAADHNSTFDAVRKNLIDSGKVREAVEIPSGLLNGNPNIDQLRKLGARFQTDIIILVSGDHEFSRARNQELSFWDSFSDQVFYQSKVTINAIALDVYTGTLLSPFDASIKGEPIKLAPGTSDFAETRYQYQKEIETQTWKALGDVARQNLITLEQEVKKRKAEIDTAVQNEPIQETETNTDTISTTNSKREN